MIKNKKFQIDRYDANTMTVVVYDKFLANRLNRALDMYYDTKIKEGEEPLFLISDQKLPLFLTKMPRGIDRVVLGDLIKKCLLKSEL